MGINDHVEITNILVFFEIVQGIPVPYLNISFNQVVQSNLQQLSRIFTEFIQNAEDARSEKIQFEVLEHAVRIANDVDLELVIKAGKHCQGLQH